MQLSEGGPSRPVSQGRRRRLARIWSRQQSKGGDLAAADSATELERMFRLWLPSTRELAFVSNASDVLPTDGAAA